MNGVWVWTGWLLRAYWSRRRCVYSVTPPPQIPHPYIYISFLPLTPFVKSGWNLINNAPLVQVFFLNLKTTAPDFNFLFYFINGGESIGYWTWILFNFKGRVSREVRHKLLYIIRKSSFFYTFDAWHEKKIKPFSYMDFRPIYVEK
jgi:hypothetical protein